MKNRYIIYEREGADPARDRIVFSRGDTKVTIIAAGQPATLLTTLGQQLADEGATSLELCGGMNARLQMQLIQAMQGKVAVNAIGYHFESFSTIAEYKYRFEVGDAPFKEAFIIGLDGADPNVDVRTVKNKRCKQLLYVSPKMIQPQQLPKT